MTDTYKYSLVSLFSGAGGFDWGFHQTGRFETLLACERLPEPAYTLAHNLGLTLVVPNGAVPIKKVDKPSVVQSDIRNLDYSEAVLSPDVLIGGPPCQDFSITISKKGGGRPGLNSGRGKLYVEFVRAVMFLQPKIFVFENVPGLLSANEREAFRTILDDLRHLEKRRIEALEGGSRVKVPSKPIIDYEIIFKSIVDGTRLGVPQTRKRLIIIGLRKDFYTRFSPFDQQDIYTSLCNTLEGRNSLFDRFPLTCLEVFEGKPLNELQDKYKEIMLAYQDIANNPKLPRAAIWREQVWDKLILDDIRHDYFLANQIEETQLNIADYEKAMQVHVQLLKELGWSGKPIIGKGFKDGTNKNPRQSMDVSNRMAMIPPDQNYSFVDGTEWEVVGKEISFIYRRSSPLKPAWTVMAYGGGGTYGYHYERNRSQLTLRERARIQTFSDDFVFPNKKVRAQIGEAVPPLLGKRIAESVIPILEKCTVTANDS